MRKKLFGWPLGIGLLIAVCGCSTVTKVTDIITNPTAREVYEREINKDTFALWQAAHDHALQNPVDVALPYGETGILSPSPNIAYGYAVQLNAGEVLTADISKDATTQRVFMEIYEWDGSAYQPVESTEAKAPHIEFPAKQTGTYKLVLQPEIAASTPFFLAINKKPLYGFPVAGKGNAAIGSFWADVRDGGARSHEGIDIFAKRGTPVVAATNGTIGFTGERGIGGKQVWLRTGLFGNSLYYAHLDRIAIASGAKVNAGDTLGFVGNTGNAKGTVPHLHFGIYGFSGAVNPLPYVYKTGSIKRKSFPLHFKNPEAKVKSKARLRRGPSGNYAIVDELPANQALTLLGQHKDWLHVKTSLGQTGFVSRKLVRAIH
jgi:murein DD-endopeptidase MepM/ murein hydrolase activator NlpD